MMNKNNPLRISQESLDLDDIISDLNSEVKANVSEPQMMAVEGLKMKTASVNSTVNKQKSSLGTNK
jgi:hypothetical protein